MYIHNRCICSYEPKHHVPSFWAFNDATGDGTSVVIFVALENHPC
jgi:hypothetical protein